MSEPPIPIESNLVALHGHWVVADGIKAVASARVPGHAGLPPDIHDFAQVWSSMYRMLAWYALLYVVVEGYAELDLSDERIDALLRDAERVDLLRRFRNSVFHFQEDPMPRKRTEFLEAAETETWAHELNKAFEQLFLRELPIRRWLASLDAGTDS